MASKVALLIGSGDYQYPNDFNLLETAARNVAALQQLFEDPEIGGFNEVQVLTHPTESEMRRAIAILFSPERSKKDTLLFYFAGHGVKDDSGRLYFAAKDSERNLLGATAVLASWVHQQMNTCWAKRQIVILDCCFSGAFDPQSNAMADNSVDLRQMVGTTGADGRVAFASSSGLEYSFERKGMDLSIYTRFLVEGIKTGAGDLDEDGAIRADELHDYVSQRVRDAEPKMKPKIIVLKDQGYEVVISKTQPTDPKLKYRRAVKKYAATGKIRPSARSILDVLRQELNLSQDVTEQIEFEFLRPFREHEANLQTYRNALTAEIQQCFPLDQEAVKNLEDLQLQLNLRDEETSRIYQQVKNQINLKSTIPETSKLVNPLLPASVSKSKIIVPSSPKIDISRRQMLRYSALGVTGLGTALSIREILKFVRETNTAFNTVLDESESSPQSLKSFIEKGIATDIPLEMIEIPAGTFWMGTPESETDRNEDEGPQHKVSVPEFYLGKYEVTQIQWRAVAGWEKVDRDLPGAPSKNSQGGSYPVDSVTWLEAVEFCKRLSRGTGRAYRLPSEAEWEYACRAVKPVERPEELTLELWNQQYLTRFYSGNDNYDSSLGQYAWYGQNSNSQSHPVGEKKPNNFGLYDMHGNLWEWCQDDWHPSYVGAPNNGSAWLNKSDGNISKVLRGGSWFSYPWDCRSADRFFISRDDRSNIYGLRVACSV
ncbi:Sulphatase-modifying factor protein [[Leptolyngbya] sp. PCC 7376]|uniref:caspase, EACC1-associated type n=1 Tax=[Leptolyngbya] sp. PCC 7376 TaxID=111781 RepID=UPI00029EC697|nr:SUMF1/EgtB/PvdO family nonheme iron enzyme [[Leptolyngbya] sp. PCC 7376]AFY39696.1 Sulphatase-modifying factor protein [[Leptolyngbya] sp. PCC 7376]